LWVIEDSELARIVSHFEAECVWCKKEYDNDKFQLGFRADHKSNENINTIKIIMELLASPDDMIL